jgi:hypothetical protein
VAFHEVRDGDTGELVIKYDPEKDRIEYRNRRGALKYQYLADYRAAVKERSAADERRAR